MWQAILALVSKVRAPIAKDATTGQGEIIVSVTNGNATMLIPSWLAGKYAEFTAHAASVDVLFGASTAEVVYGQTSSIDGTTKAVTVNANTGRRVVDGTTRTFIVPSTGATHLAWEGSGNGTLHIGVSSQKVEK